MRIVQKRAEITAKEVFLSQRFRNNLAYAINLRFGSAYKDQMLADALGVDRSSISRMRNGTTMPRFGRLERLSQIFGIVRELWDLPEEKFRHEYRRSGEADFVTQAARVSVSMPAVELHRHLWKPSFETHRGEYIAYWKDQGRYAASLLRIGELNTSGLQFEMVSPAMADDVAAADTRCRVHQGAVYPVADYLYFFGQQVDSASDLLSMIMTAAPIGPPDVLRGCLSGITLNKGSKQIAVTMSVVLAYLKKPMAEWRSELGKRLGTLPAEAVPQRIRNMIDPLPGVVPLG